MEWTTSLICSRQVVTQKLWLSLAGCEGDHETDVRETVQETVPVPGVQDVSDAHQVPGQREATPTCGHQDAAPLLPDIRLFPQGEKLRRTNWYPRDSYPTRRNNASGNATLFLTLPLTQCRRRKCLRFRWQFRLLRQPVVCSHADEGFGRLLPGRWWFHGCLLLLLKCWKWKRDEIVVTQQTAALFFLLFFF